MKVYRKLKSVSEMLDQFPMKVDPMTPTGEIYVLPTHFTYWVEDGKLVTRDFPSSPTRELTENEKRHFGVIKNLGDNKETA